MKRLISIALCALLALGASAATFPPHFGVFGASLIPHFNVKFNPGWYLESDNNDGSPAADGGSGGNLTEIQILGTTGTGGTYTGSNWLGFSPIYHWGFLEPSAGTYNFAAIRDDFNNLQQYAPGARLIIQVKWANASGSGATINDPPYIPADILTNCATYGAGPTGGTDCGWGLSGYTSFNASCGTPGGTHWAIAAAAMWRTAVQNRWANFMTQLANYSFTVTQGPLAGQTFTVDNNPLIEGFFDWTEDSWNFWCGPQTAGDYTDNALLTGLEADMTNGVAAFPHTDFATFQSFGWANDSFPSPSLPPLIAYASSHRNSMSNADVYPPTSGICGVTGICAQETYIGLVWNGTNWVGGGTDYIGTMQYDGNVQPLDYQNNPATTVPQIFTTLQTLEATHGVLTDWDEHTGTPSTFVSTYLTPFINAHPIPNTTRPSNLN